MDELQIESTSIQLVLSKGVLTIADDASAQVQQTTSKGCSIVDSMYTAARSPFSAHVNTVADPKACCDMQHTCTVHNFDGFRLVINCSRGQHSTVDTPLLYASELVGTCPSRHMSILQSPLKSLPLSTEPRTRARHSPDEREFLRPLVFVHHHQPTQSTTEETCRQQHGSFLFPHTCWRKRLITDVGGP
jgi:hypothetical protein